MDYMPMYQDSIKFIANELGAVPETSLYELVSRFVVKYKELEKKISIQEKKGEKNVIPGKSK